MASRIEYAALAGIFILAGVGGYSILGSRADERAGTRDGALVLPTASSPGAASLPAVPVSESRTVVTAVEAPPAIAGAAGEQPVSPPTTDPPPVIPTSAGDVPFHPSEVAKRRRAGNRVGEMNREASP